MWILGVVFTMLGSGINQFFSLRYPAVKIVSLVAELVAFPCGVFLAKILPLYTLNLGPLGSFCINPDRHFNIKEHALVTIMANVSFGFGNADATLIIQAATAFYGFKLEAGFKVLIVLCCQLLGFGVAGLSAPWIVKPAEMIWPGVLSNCALLSTLHSRSNAIADGWKISRLRFFMYVLGGAFVWYFFPGMIFTGLSYFTWICWIAPNNLVVNQLFGMYSGLGLSPITFDWSQVAYVTNPLLSPFWAAANAFAGFAIFFWLVVPGIFYTNTWYTAYMPVMSADVYDRFNDLYNTTKVVNSQGILDVDLYKQYSPPYLPAAFAFVYGLSFAAITSVLTHIAIWHGKDIWEVIKGRQQLDIHGRMMEKYKQLPYYYYAIVTVVVTAMGIGMAEGYNTNLPWWGVILALVIPAVYMVPCGLIQGVTNINANQINVLSEFIGGYMFAGKPLANMIFKILSVDVVGQGLYFAQDMKLGHYLKIAPRTLFWAQGIATVLGALTNLGVNQWALANIDGICESGQPSGFSCPNGRTVFSSSVIWGLVGPGRLYSVGKIYSSLLHFFWIGALMPFTTWALYKWTGREFWKLVNWPIIFASVSNTLSLNHYSANKLSPDRRRSPRNRCELLLMGRRQLRLQPPDLQTLLQMVDKIQLRSRRGSRHRSRAVGHLHFLLHHVSWRCIPGLVGQYRLGEYCGWNEYALEGYAQCWILGA